MCTSGRGQVLLPWPNRIEDGTYEFDGRRHQLPLNEPELRNAIHGLVRWSAWTTREREPSRVVVEHMLHPQPGYPFSLAVTHRVRALRRGPLRGDHGHERRAGAVPVRVRRTSVPDARNGGRRLRRPAAPGRAVLHSDERGLPDRPGGGRGHGVRLPPAEARSARRGSTTASPTSSGTRRPCPRRAPRLRTKAPASRSGWTRPTAT